MTFGLSRFHRDTRGAISILVLLTMWCLVAMIAMIWNNVEYSAKRQLLQNASDSLAQSTARLNAQMTNMVAAQNMIIAQDGAAETVWTAVTPTYNNIDHELNVELAQAEAILSGADPTISQWRQTLINQLRQCDNEYALLETDLDAVVAGEQAITFPNKQAQAEYAYEVARMQAAVAAVKNYLETLRSLAAQYTQNTKLTDQMVELIISYIGQERQLLTNFKTQTDPAIRLDFPSMTLQHQQTVHQNELNMLEQLKTSMDTQRQQLAAFYKANLEILTDTGGVDNEPYAADVSGPVMDAAYAATVESHEDSIRVNHPLEASAAGLGPYVAIDPINPHTNENRIWYPNVVVPVPGIYELDTGPMPAISVNCNVPGGWGHSYAFPIEHYLSNRVANDQQNLNANYMIPIDDLRKALAVALQAVSGTTSTILSPPPTTIPDVGVDPITKLSTPISIMPQVTAPSQSNPTYRTAVQNMNQHARTFNNRVKNLYRALNGYGLFWNRFTDVFAQRVWSIEIRIARDQILQGLGQDRNFMVLSSYQLHKVPDWAQSGMYQSAYEAIYQKIIETNLNPVSATVLAGLVRVNPWHLGGTIPMLQASYSPYSSQIALTTVQQAAAIAAPEIANEMLSREWPYEFAPPTQPVPPSRGMSRPDRQRYFSFIGIARPTEETTPKLLLPFLFEKSTYNLMTYGQAEAFTWMEYNQNYGGSEFFDQVSSDGYGEFLCCPRAWRTSSVGGWNWQNRLSVADALIAYGWVTTTNDPAPVPKGPGLEADAAAMPFVNAH